MNLVPKLTVLRDSRRRPPPPPPSEQLPSTSDLLAALPAPREMQRRIQRERHLCGRGRPPFAVVVFDVGDPGHEDDLAVRLVEAFRRRARLCDEIGWFGRQRIAALLPVTPHWGAHAFAVRLAGDLAATGRQPMLQVFCM